MTKLGFRRLFTTSSKLMNLQTKKERAMFKKKNGAEFMTDQTVRQRLLTGAAELFARKGYASTTVREIVEAAKVTKPALYYYFRSKEGIYLELMRAAEARFEILLDSARKEIGEVKIRIFWTRSK
jgi:AcrR family transcriptional regulator